MAAVMLGLTAVMLGLIYYYFTANFSHWRTKSVPCMKAYPVVGSMGRVFTLKEHMSEFFERAYREMYNYPYGGFFQGRTPVLLVKDPEIIKNIIIKDFQHFTDHGFEVDEKVDPLQARNLFNMEGAKWKAMRSTLSPTFTTGRMKIMFPLVLECADVFDKYLNKLASRRIDSDIKDLLARYTTDVISSCAFGVTRDSINNPDDQFRVMGRRMLGANLLQALRNATIFFAPEIARRLKFRFFDEEVTEFFRSTVKDVIETRMRTGKTRKDFMQLMIELKEKGKVADIDPNEKHEYENEHVFTQNMQGNKWTQDDIVSQAMGFFLAGFETSSSAMTFALFELARRPDLQRTARRHIQDVLQRHDGQVTYEALQEMTYLDWILQESLRKYSPVTVINRKCNKDYVIPTTNVIIEKGTLVAIPIHAMQNDPYYFPEPERFHPERFADEETQERTRYIFLPFGDGPRQCIGLRFARMQSKMGLMTLLRKYEVKQSPKTKYPLTFDPKQFILASKENIFLKIVYASD